MINIAKKNKPNILISFIDEPAAEGVTGSLVYVETPNHKILLDAGFHQSNDIKSDYEINNRNFRGFKYKEIDTIILSHNHGDHTFLAPILYKKGCRATTYISKDSKELLNLMLQDCAKINERDAEYLSKKGKEYLPLFTTEDIDLFMDYVKEIPVKQEIQISDELSIRLIHSGHLTKGCQIELYIKINNRKEKILYTGDLGSKYIKEPFTEKLEYVEKANIVIAESTHGWRKDLKITMKERQKDLNKLKDLIVESVINNKGRLVIPVFAQSRAQTVLYLLYSIFGKNNNFKTKVYIDSPLAKQIFELYSTILLDKEKELFDEMMTWKNIVFIKDYETSLSLLQSSESCIVLSTSGMCNVGRIRNHIETSLSRPNDVILFVGYTADGTLGSELIKGSKVVELNKKSISVTCKIEMLTTLSSHITYFGMLDYYGNINCNKLILHHGCMEGKKQLKMDLEEVYSQKCKTTNVLIANKDFEITI